jgi:hypothetical protein
MTIAAAPPTISATIIPTITDTNAATVAVTGNNSQIVSGVSVLNVNIPANMATANGGATISRYEVRIGDRTVTRTATGAFAFGIAEISGNGNMRITVTDSRGASSFRDYPFTGFAYQAPSLIVNTERENNFDNLTNISMSGQMSLIGGRNQMRVFQWRRRAANEQIWTTWQNVTPAWTSQSNYSGGFAQNLDQRYAHVLEFEMSDRLRTSVATVTVHQGIPNLAIDTNNQRVGINTFPTTHEFEVSGFSHSGAEIKIGITTNRIEAYGGGQHLYVKPVNVATGELRVAEWVADAGGSTAINGPGGGNQLINWCVVRARGFVGTSDVVQQPLPVAAGFRNINPSGVSQLRINREGRHVTITGILVPTVAFTGSATTIQISTIPEGLRPIQVDVVTMSVGSGLLSFGIHANASGVLGISRLQDNNGFATAAATTTETGQGGGTWLPINISYLIN